MCRQHGDPAISISHRHRCTSPRAHRRPIRRSGAAQHVPQQFLPQSGIPKPVPTALRSHGRIKTSTLATPRTGQHTDTCPCLRMCSLEDKHKRLTDDRHRIILFASPFNLFTNSHFSVNHYYFVQAILRCDANNHGRKTQI